MRKFLQWLLSGFVSRIADKYSSKPNKKRIHEALDALYASISFGNNKKGILLQISSATDKIIILSDQHKGIKDGSDNFAFCENNYLHALDYYNQEGYKYIQLGDAEELWENTLAAVKKVNTASFLKEQLFIKRGAFIKVFGNHDLFWDNSPLAATELEKIYGEKINIYEGVVLRTSGNNSLDIFLTHGHQGDELSDGNWFSKWFVANVWAPLQSYLSINPNTPANYDYLKTTHNKMMYEWIAPQKNKLLITGHTHQAVFQSLTHIENLYKKLSKAMEANDEKAILSLKTEIQIKHQKGQLLPDFTGYQPTYFNSGCCCFNDGDITGIEIVAGNISLIKWEYSVQMKIPERVLLDTASLNDLFTS